MIKRPLKKIKMKTRENFDMPTAPTVAVQQHHLGLILHQIYTTLRQRKKHAVAECILNTPVFVDANCSYTVDKSKVFIKVADRLTGKWFPSCVVEQVILHEFAHVLDKKSVGHDAAFEKTLASIIDHRAHDLQQCLVPPSYICGGGATAPLSDPSEGRVPVDIIINGDITHGQKFTTQTGIFG